MKKGVFGETPKRRYLGQGAIFLKAVVKASISWPTVVDSVAKIGLPMEYSASEFPRMNMMFPYFSPKGDLAVMRILGYVSLTA